MALQLFNSKVQMCNLGRLGDSAPPAEPRPRPAVARSAQKDKNHDELVRAWEAVGGNKDLSGSVSLMHITEILQVFELKAEMVHHAFVSTRTSLQ